jgi:hypothetical protein
MLANCTNPSSGTETEITHTHTYGETYFEYPSVDWIIISPTFELDGSQYRERTRVQICTGFLKNSMCRYRNTVTEIIDMQVLPRGIVDIDFSQYYDEAGNVKFISENEALIALNTIRKAMGGKYAYYSTLLNPWLEQLEIADTGMMTNTLMDSDVPHTLFSGWGAMGTGSSVFERTTGYTSIENFGYLYRAGLRYLAGASTFEEYAATAELLIDLIADKDLLEIAYGGAPFSNNDITSQQLNDMRSFIITKTMSTYSIPNTLENIKKLTAHFNTHFDDVPQFSVLVDKIKTQYPAEWETNVLDQPYNYALATGIINEVTQP